jgi:pyruvate dehydrogenase complex dehydrogenase (E1) component
MVQAIWIQYKKLGSIMLPNGRVIKIDNPTPQKLLNYYVQCLETVNNVKKLTALKELFKGKKSKVILVVYDSILIDYSAEDGKGFLSQIKAVLEEGNYKVKAQKGDTYDFTTN